MYQIALGTLLNKPEGYSFKENDATLASHFEETPDLESETPIVFDLEVIRLAHEFTVHISDVHFEGTTTCSRCLVPIPLTIDIESASRQFIYDLPKEEINPDEDVFYVDRKETSLDIAPFIREELLLHFPSFPVCSSGCKGLCPTCGVNRNTTSCSCNTGSADNPFKNLLSL